MILYESDELNCLFDDFRFSICKIYLNCNLKSDSALSIILTFSKSILCDVVKWCWLIAESNLPFCYSTRSELFDAIWTLRRNLNSSTRSELPYFLPIWDLRNVKKRNHMHVAYCFIPKSLKKKILKKIRIKE